MPKFEFETLGRDWQSNLHDPPALAAFDDVHDRVKLGARDAVTAAFRSLDVESDDRANQSYVVKGDIDGDSFSLTVGQPAKPKAKKKTAAKK